MGFFTRFGSTADRLKKGRILHYFLCDFSVKGTWQPWKYSYEISLNRDRFLCYFLTV
jgi:hypothetical protein